MSDSNADIGERSMQIHAGFFDATTDILKSAQVDDDGRVGKPEVLGPAMAERAKELAPTEPNHALLAWVESRKAQQQLSIRDLLNGYQSSQSADPDETQQKFTAWVQDYLLEGGELQAAGLEPDKVDWEVFTMEMMQHLMAGLDKLSKQ